jgi:hypothetical protein
MLATNQVIPLNRISELSLYSYGEEWKTLIETIEISIYYVKIENNPCMSYKLKIVNHTNKIQTVSFDIIAKIADDCKYQYKNFNEFRYRTVEIKANATIIGDENIKSLLLPTTNGSVKGLIQNLSVK